MTLPVPNLDDRDFRSLIEEAKTRIPNFTGEWTNFNDSDPGMTLVQLHAWLTETLLYQVNRLPDLAYVNFLNLLGTTPTPARAAHAELTFTLADLDKADDPLTVLVPLGVQVGVDDPNLDEPVVFETDQSLRGINATVAAIVVPSTTDTGEQMALGEYDVDEATLKLPQPFRPFGDGTVAGEMRIGLLLRPIRDDDEDYFLDRFPEGELDVAVFTPDVFEPDADGETIDGPFGTECLFPWEAEDDSGLITWEVYVGANAADDFDNDAAWQALSLRGDDTAGLRLSGHLFLDMPTNLPPVALGALSRSYWESLDLRKPPSNPAELIDDLDNGVFVATDLALDVWKEQLGLVDPVLTDLAALTVLIAAIDSTSFDNVAEETWVELGYSASPAPHGLVWIRARTTEAITPAPQISTIGLNTAPATASTRRSSEVLGTSAGRPNQTFRLKRSPILIDPVSNEPELTIDVVDPTGERVETWERGVDFYGADRGTRRYLIDALSGVVAFGDGVNGMIPVAGSRIVAATYGVGGGAIGNVAANTIIALKTALPQVKSVTNLRAADGGSDAETLDEAKLRAPQLLRTRDRAVTSDDFADLAMRTPGVGLRSAYALPLTRLDVSTEPATRIENVPGAVTVVVVPRNDEPTPQPSREQLRLICAFLNERRLITTELYVDGPHYLDIVELRVEVLARGDADLKAVQDACRDAIETYFHPIHGGDDSDAGDAGSMGWPIGGDIYVGNVFDRLLAQEGVARVAELSIGTTAESADLCLDVLDVPAGTLVHLPAGVLSIDVRYDRGR